MSDYSVAQSLVEKPYWPEYRNQIINQWRSEKSKIREFAYQRNIQRLCHFTQGENLVSIYKNGLMSRNEIKAKGLQSIRMDSSAKILFEDFIYASVSEPNKTMMESKYSSGAWPVIIILDPKILWKQPFFSVPFNSARMEVNEYLENNRNETIGLKALESIYRGKMIREQYDISHSVPTDPASELLFLGSIAPKYFKMVLISEIIRNTEKFLKFADYFGFFESGSFKKYEWKEIKAEEIRRWSWANDQEANNARKWRKNWVEDGD